MKVLIIEDEPAVCYFLEQVVLTAGHDVRVEQDGDAGLAAYGEFCPDLILSDYRLPGRDGLQILEEVRKKDNDVTFIVMTGYGSEEFAVRALQLRANNYLHKPIRHEVLTGLLQKYSEIIRARNIRDEVRRMVVRRETILEMDNRLDMASGVVDFLVAEAGAWLTAEQCFAVQLGLYELVVNAIEHGNLEISYEEKYKALFESPTGLMALVEKRSRDEDKRNRRVRIEFRHYSDRLEWLITDQGPGFDWYALPNPLLDSNVESLNGRGIFLARFQFDDLTYLGGGNRVRATKKITLPEYNI